MDPTPADSRPRVLAFGEVLWDVFGSEEHIGGAPFNFAAHAVRCGLAADLLSCVGADARGERARAEIRRLEVGDGFVATDPTRPTGRVDVQLRDGQPTYTIAANAAWDAIPRPADQALRQHRYAALVCGTLAQRGAASRATLRKVRDALAGVPVFYDVNLRPPHTPLELVLETLAGVTWLKLNADEAEALWREGGGGAFDATVLFDRLARQVGLRTLILTRGADGASVYTRDGAWHAAAAAIRLVSAVGAGDSFAAAFLAGCLQGHAPERCLQRATQVAGWVASCAEAIPEYPGSLREG